MFRASYDGRCLDERWIRRYFLGVRRVDRPMAKESDPVVGDDVSPLEVLLELSSSAREDSLPGFLETVADIVCRTAGFRAVVLNSALLVGG
jgi:hypothetical protein